LHHERAFPLVRERSHGTTVQPLEIRSLRNWTEAKRAAHQVNVTVAALSKMQFCEDVDFATQKRHLRPLQFSHRIHLMRPTQIYDIKKKRNKKRASQVAQVPLINNYESCFSFR
jgi:hypothetical protein